MAMSYHVRAAPRIAAAMSRDTPCDTHSVLHVSGLAPPHTPPNTYSILYVFMKKIIQGGVGGWGGLQGGVGGE